MLMTLLTLVAAAGDGVVFVAPVDGAQAAEAARVRARVTQALEAAQVPLVDLDVAFPPAKPTDEAPALIAAAKSDFDDLDYAAALDKTQKALDAWVAHPATADAAQVAWAHRFIGALALQLEGAKAEDRAQANFRRALGLDPKGQFDGDAWGQSGQALYEKVRTAMAAEPKPPLNVDGPAGAHVELDGRALGTLPLAEAPTVGPGQHLVKATLPGHAPAGALVDAGNAPVQVSLQPAPAPAWAEALQRGGALAREGVGAQRMPEAAKALGETAQARFLVMGTADGRKAPLEVWDTQTGNRLLGLSGADDAAAADAAPRVKAFFEDPVRLASAPPTSAGFFSGPVYKKWWFWTAVGVVVAGGATAAGVAAASSSKSGYNVVLGIP